MLLVRALFLAIPELSGLVGESFMATSILKSIDDCHQQKSAQRYKEIPLDPSLTYHYVSTFVQELAYIFIFHLNLHIRSLPTK